jgi:hypothetical protein
VDLCRFDIRVSNSVLNGKARLAQKSDCSHLKWIS